MLSATKLSRTTASSRARLRPNDRSGVENTRIAVTAQLKKILYITAGILSVVIGTIGAFIPLLPTVPFLLLAAYFFARSSPRFYMWLHTNRWFGKILTNYSEGRGIPLKAKVYLIVLFWLVVGYSLVNVIESTVGKIIMAAVGVGVTIHLLLLKTYRESQDETRASPLC